MTLSQRLSAHLARPVDRAAAVMTFIGSAGVLLLALVIGAGLLVALVFFFGFGTDDFVRKIGADTVPLVKQGAIGLAAVGGVSFAAFILGSCMIVASIFKARYRAAYLSFAAILLPLLLFSTMYISANLP